jgi:hypothetical protein
MNIARAINRVKRVVLIAVVACVIGCVLAGGYSFSSLYYKWSTGMIRDADDWEYHDPYTLGRCKVAGLNFGACFGEVRDGSYAFSCDEPVGHASASEQWVLGNGRNGCALSLCSTFGRKSFTVLVPLPSFEPPDGL